MPLRNCSHCESAKLISPDKRYCRFPRGLGKIPAGIFRGFQISSAQQLDTQTLTIKTFLVSGHTSFFTDRPSLANLSPRVKEALDMSHRMHNHELSADTTCVHVL
ncbi:unnamed protein product [Rangifer tarandus platyrhynchus]|uniref:Uncharacterized protein n=2 Tax=Rangifer tarandus platyrhynchus TaxID=3082113 RepID=A0ABN8XX03_RANTA|nr:unnamed protein product [Rangifer tarandus platyrhynchus]